MRRRDLLKGGAVAAAGIALPNCSSGDVATRGRADVDDEPRGSKAENRGDRVDLPHPELEEVDVAQLQIWLRSGSETVGSLVAKYRTRIDATNTVGPKLRAVLALADRDDVSQLDAEAKAGALRGPLHGVPVLVKDNIDTAGPLPTTAGSLALANSYAMADAPLVARLRAAGAVVIGKSNLSEWANLRGNQSISGWSALGGQCRNPFALDRSASGSSSGSAAAVSANLCAVAVGTETDGSLVSPGSCCGIVAVKPTVGLISQKGIIPISSSQDTAGPMARTVRDAAILLGVLADTPATTRHSSDATRSEALGSACREPATSISGEAWTGSWRVRSRSCPSSARSSWTTSSSRFHPSCRRPSSR